MREEEELEMVLLENDAVSMFIVDLRTRHSDS